MRTRLAPLMLTIACAGADPDGADPACDGLGDQQVLLARRMVFVRLASDGVSEGFDLDDAVSDDGECAGPDLLSPEGTPGIDNAMSSLLPILETTEASAIEPLIQDSINGGAMLLMFDMSDLDDPSDDACVDLSVYKGVGAPMLGSDGWILPNQTLPVDPESTGNEALANPMADGRLDAGPFDQIALPIQVLDLDTTLIIHHARVRLEDQGDGTWRGLLGGGLAVQDLVDVATLQNVDPAVYELIGPFLDLMADLEPDEDGACTQISATLELELVPAFAYEEP